MVINKGNVKTNVKVVVSHLLKGGGRLNGLHIVAHKGLIGGLGVLEIVVRKSICKGMGRRMT